MEGYKPLYYPSGKPILNDQGQHIHMAVKDFDNVQAELNSKYSEGQEKERKRFQSFMALKKDIPSFNTKKFEDIIMKGYLDGKELSETQAILSKEMAKMMKDPAMIAAMESPPDIAAGYDSDYIPKGFHSSAAKYEA